MIIKTQLPQVQGYTPRQMDASFNQSMAAAHQAADPRFAVKGLDRQGMSRGAGQQYMGGISSARSLADGVAQAYSQNLADQAANADISNDAMAEGFGLGIGAIGQQAQYASALAALQRQQQAMQGNILGGLLSSGGLSQFLGY